MTSPPIDPGNEVSANPSKTSVQDILARIDRTQGYGLRENEIRKLAEYTRKLENLIRLRAAGWYPEERQWLVANGVLYDDNAASHK